MAVLFQLLAACSVQKRRYTRGYTLQWKKSAVHPRPASDAITPVSVSEHKAESLPAVKSGDQEIKTTDAVTTDKVSAGVLRNNKQAIRKENKQVKNVSKSTRVEPKRLPDNPAYNETKFLVEALLSFIFILLALVGFLVSLYVAIIGAYLALVFFLFLSFVLYAASFILSIIAIIKKAMDPEKYSGAWMAIFAFVACTLLAGFFLSSIIL